MVQDLVVWMRHRGPQIREASICQMIVGLRAFRVKILDGRV